MVQTIRVIKTYNHLLRLFSAPHGTRVLPGAPGIAVKLVVCSGGSSHGSRIGFPRFPPRSQDREEHGNPCRCRSGGTLSPGVDRPSLGCSVAAVAMWWRQGNPDHRTPSSTLTPGFMEAASTSIYAQCAETCYGDGPLDSAVIPLVGKSRSRWRSLGSRVGVQLGFYGIYDGANHNDRGRW